MSLISIFGSVVLPIFVLIGIGTLMDRLFQLDLPTLGKLNFYVFVPALLFIKTIEAELDGSVLVQVAGFGALHLLILHGVARAVAAYALPGRASPVISLGAAIPNTGNYGIPLCIMAFGDEYVGVMAMLILVQNFFIYTYGIWLFQKEQGGAFHMLRDLAKVPVIYAIAAALTVRGLDLNLPMQIHRPLGLLADGLIPVALITLGAQLSRSTVARKDLRPLTAVTCMRLGLGPLVAASLVSFFDFPAPVSSLLIVACGLPIAVNIYILAAEYEQDEALASQAIFWSTLLSGVTVSVLLSLVL